MKDKRRTKMTEKVYASGERTNGAVAEGVNLRYSVNVSAKMYISKDPKDYGLFARICPDCNTENIADISVDYAKKNQTQAGYEYQCRDCNKLFYGFSLESKQIDK